MELDLSKEETAAIQASLKRYMAEEFDIDMGDLQANLLLRYVLAEIGLLYITVPLRTPNTFSQKRSPICPAYFSKKD